MIIDKIIMDNNLNFLSDINKYSSNNKKNIKFNNIELSVETTRYDNRDIIPVIDNWKSCLELLNRSHILVEKEFMKIIYAILSDAVVINTINGIENKIDFYNSYLDIFMNLETVNKSRRIIKVKPLIICNTLIIVDCKNLESCRVYEIYDIDNIRDYYQDSKIDFDCLRDDLQLTPKVKFDLNRLNKYFKILSSKNAGYNMTVSIKQLQKYIEYQNELERRMLLECDKLLDQLRLANSSISNNKKY